jgi:hypothetical protein
MSPAASTRPTPDMDVTLPDTDIDGAVVELHRDADGTVVADVRIPAHQDNG